MGCAVCGADAVFIGKRDIPYAFEGREGVIPDVAGEHCDDCGESVVDRIDSSRVLEAMRAFKRAA